jgi:hypothetical protein
MSSATAKEILDNITAKCLDVHPDVFPIPVAPAGILPRYDAACVAVANARTVDEVREIAASAEALRLTQGRRGTGSSSSTRRKSASGPTTTRVGR